MDSTICAISTSSGVGAISIIRVSGPDAIKIVNKIFKGKDLSFCASHTINYGHIIYNNEIIDEVLVSVMKAPKTFTCEDVVEINSHGGLSTTNKILEILLNNGCTLAEPGEFTKRAFLNGRIDLVEAESIMDIISSESEKSRKLALNGLTGEITNKIKELRKKIIEIESNIEVNIDFPEYEEGEDYTKEKLKSLCLELDEKMKSLIELSTNGKIIKQGINVALLGKPNVGKSSILNSLLEEEKAIVTDIPGTTRDLVEGKINLNGVIINLIDTAGIRETTDLVEKLGVDKSLKVSSDADLVIYVIDNNIGITKEDVETIETIKNKKVIIFINKNDLPSKINLDKLQGYNIIYGNTLTKKGLNELKNKIVEIYNINDFDSSDLTFLSNARQLSLLKKAEALIKNIINNIDSYPIDMSSIDLKNAYELLGQIIGETYEDDLLDELFSRFCLGK